VPELRNHLDVLGQFAALVFTSPQGTPRHGNFYRRACVILGGWRV